MILQLGRVAPQGLQHHVGGAVPHLAAGDVTVLDGHNGALRIVGGQVVNHHLTVGAELAGDPAGQLEQKLQCGRVGHVPHLFPRVLVLLLYHEGEILQEKLCKLKIF